jgi:hypothetical protein
MKELKPRSLVSGNTLYMYQVDASSNLDRVIGYPE